MSEEDSKLSTEVSEEHSKLIEEYMKQNKLFIPKDISEIPQRDPIDTVLGELLVPGVSDDLNIKSKPKKK